MADKKDPHNLTNIAIIEYIIPAREGLRDGVLPIAGILIITGVLVAIFATFLHFGHGLSPLVTTAMEEELWFKGAGIGIIITGVSGI